MTAVLSIHVCQKPGVRSTQLYLSHAVWEEFGLHQEAYVVVTGYVVKVRPGTGGRITPRTPGGGGKISIGKALDQLVSTDHRRNSMKVEAEVSPGLIQFDARDIEVVE